MKKYRVASIVSAIRESQGRRSDYDDTDEGQDTAGHLVALGLHFEEDH